MDKGVILVVDDDATAANLIKRILDTEVGHELSIHHDPCEALEFFERRWQDVRLVITDYLMPGMNGDTLAARIRSKSLSVPILMLSAHTTAEAIGGGTPSGRINEFVAKPFGRAEFIALVKKLLDAHGEDEPPQLDLFLQHFTHQARIISKGGIPQGYSKPSYILGILERKGYDKKRLEEMRVLQEVLEAELEYLVALRTVETLRKGEEERQRTIRKWLDDNKDLTMDWVLPKDDITGG